MCEEYVVVTKPQVPTDHYQILIYHLHRSSLLIPFKKKKKHGNTFIYPQKPTLKIKKVIRISNWFNLNYPNNINYIDDINDD